MTGFDNLEVALKYVFFKSEPHEALGSLGLSWDVGGTGSHRVGAENHDTVTPALFFGKGFGDLPEALDAVKPVALTGTFGVALPTRRLSHHLVTEDDGTISLEREVNPVTAKWGFSVQYNCGTSCTFGSVRVILAVSGNSAYSTCASGPGPTGTVTVVWNGLNPATGLAAVNGTFSWVSRPSSR